jgi:hypothetical protein
MRLACLSGERGVARRWAYGGRRTASMAPVAIRGQELVRDLDRGGVAIASTLCAGPADSDLKPARHPI